MMIHQIRYDWLDRLSFGWVVCAGRQLRKLLAAVHPLVNS